MVVALTADEEKVQHEVTGLLGAAYGVALAVVAAHEAPYAKNTAVTTHIMKSVYRQVGARDFDANDNYDEEAYEAEADAEDNASGLDAFETEDAVEEAFDEESAVESELEEEELQAPVPFKAGDEAIEAERPRVASVALSDLEVA